MNELVRSVVFGGDKGGVGKTTLAYHLARYAAEQRGIPTVALSLDPTASLARRLHSEKGSNLVVGVAPQARQLPCQQSVANQLLIADYSNRPELVSLLAPRIWLFPVNCGAALEAVLANKPARSPSRSFVIFNDITALGKSLRRRFQERAEAGGFEIFPVDVPSSRTIRRAESAGRSVWNVDRRADTYAASHALRSFCSAVLECL